MNANDYLEGIRTLVGDIERTINRIQRIEDQLAVKGIQYSGAEPKSVSGDPLSSGVVELIAYHEDLDTLLERHIDEEAEAVYVIESLSTHVMRRAVSLRYLDGKPIKEIAARMGYSPDGIRDAISRAKRELDADNRLARALSEYRDCRISAR